MDAPPYEATLRIPVDEKFYEQFAGMLWKAGSDLAKKTLADDYIVRLMRHPEFSKFANKALCTAFGAMCKDIVSKKTNDNVKFIKERTDEVSDEVRLKATEQIESFVKDSEKVVATVQNQLTESMTNDIKIRFENIINAAMVAVESQLNQRIKTVASEANADWMERIDAVVQNKVEDVINNQLDDYIKQRAKHRVDMRVDHHPKLQSSA